MSQGPVPMTYHPPVVGRVVFSPETAAGKPETVEIDGRTIIVGFKAAGAGLPMPQVSDAAALRVLGRADTFDRTRPIARLFLTAAGLAHVGWYQVLADNTPGDRLTPQSEVEAYAYVAQQPWAADFYRCLMKANKATIYTPFAGTPLAVRTHEDTPDPIAILVEDAATAQALQRGVDRAQVQFLPLMNDNAVRGRRFRAAFVRWPSPNWFERRHTAEQDLQTWVRMTLMPRVTRGGDFQYI